MAFASVVALGETGVPASITLSNDNTGLAALVPNVVCSAGDPSPRCAPAKDGIVLVPSCTKIAGDRCPPGSADPGVFKVAPAGVGRTGSACSGYAFEIAPVDASGATLAVRPVSPATHVVLPGWGSRCVIDFTFDVLRMPAGDADPNAPGIQAAQATSHTQYSDSGSDTARDTDVITVGRAAPSTATVASPDIVLGAGTLSDRATVNGRVSPVAGATVDFRLYGPDDAQCARPAVFESLHVPYPVGGGAVESGSFTPTRAGTYRWVATYSGDANNEAAAGSCGDAAEVTIVARARPSIATAASPDIVLGAGTLSDQATVNGRVHPQPGATVDFRLYGPDDADCSGPPVFESLDVAQPAAGGAVMSAAFTPKRAGTYRWTAAYNGDADNAPAAGACNDANETRVVMRARTSIATAASPDIVLGGGTLSEQATVNGRVEPQAGGTIDFRVYGPDDADCSGPPVFESLDVPYPLGGGVVQSQTFTPESAGTYRWVAEYSGDANNAPVSGGCGGRERDDDRCPPHARSCDEAVAGHPDRIGQPDRRGDRDGTSQSPARGDDRLPALRTR